MGPGTTTLLKTAQRSEMGYLASNDKNPSFATKTSCFTHRRSQVQVLHRPSASFFPVSAPFFKSVCKQPKRSGNAPEPLFFLEGMLTSLPFTPIGE